METNYFFVLDTSTTINGFVGCKEKEIEQASSSIMKIIENREQTYIEAYISEQIEREVIKILGRDQQDIIESMFTVVKVDDSKYKKQIKGAEASMIPVANEIGKKYRKPVLISDDMIFVNKYHEIGYQHPLFTSKQFLLEFAPSFVCFNESCAIK